ncbi:MAG TPA: FMN-binding negative transcriptional regulator [Candidatus Acidoferrum sp.]|nr:FMN-binding negative transcriptional regulator [Candidatus Acidoferrum sp.]
MYVQQKFVENDVATLHALIRAHPLGALVVATPQGLEANHMPFHLSLDGEGKAVLRAHTPKQNPLWQQQLPSDAEALVIFQSVDTYITPSWYPSKHAHGQAVPTWNYAVVHAYGPIRFITDKDWLLPHVTALTDEHEAKHALPWQVTDAPADYIDKMLSNIVGIEIPVTRLLGKWKMSQNRPPGDRLGVVAGLSSQESDDSKAVMELVRRHT